MGFIVLGCKKHLIVTYNDFFTVCLFHSILLDKCFITSRMVKCNQLLFICILRNRFFSNLLRFVFVWSRKISIITTDNAKLFELVDKKSTVLNNWM